MHVPTQRICKQFESMISSLPVIILSNIMATVALDAMSFLSRDNLDLALNI
jgi:hypothetical protein